MKLTILLVAGYFSLLSIASATDADILSLQFIAVSQTKADPEPIYSIKVTTKQETKTVRGPTGTVFPGFSIGSYTEKGTHIEVSCGGPSITYKESELTLYIKGAKDSVGLKLRDTAKIKRS